MPSSIGNMIKDGNIVSSKETIKILKQAMLDNISGEFSIDQFSCNEEYREAFETAVSFLYIHIYIFFLTTKDFLSYIILMIHLLLQGC